MRHGRGRSFTWLFGIAALGWFIMPPAPQALADTSMAGAKLSIGGEITYLFTFIDQLAEEPGFDNPHVRNAEVDGELDFEMQWSWATARIDINLPADGNEAAGIHTANDGFGIEQLYVSYMPEFGRGAGLSFTGGAWNAPIGYESQDLEHLTTLTNGQLFGLVPSNILGVRISTAWDRFTFGVYAGNEWRADTDEQMSFGFHSSAAITEALTLSLNGIFISKAENFESGDNYLLNGIFTVEPHPCFSGAFETSWDENNLGLGATLIGHHERPIPYAVTARYDHVIAKNNSQYVENFVNGIPKLMLPITDTLLRHNIQTFTVALAVEPLPHLSVRTEGKFTDVRENGGPADEGFWTAMIGANYSF